MSHAELLERYARHPSLLEDDLKQAITIAQHDILSDMARQAEVFLHWAVLASYAEHAAKRQKRLLQEEILPRARVRAEKYLADAGRKVTVQRLDDVAMADEEYTVAVRMYERQSQLASILRDAKDAFQQRKDMLQSINSRNRAELESLPHDEQQRWNWTHEWRSGPPLTNKPDVRVEVEDALAGKDKAQLEADIQNFTEHFKRIRRTK